MPQRTGKAKIIHKIPSVTTMTEVNLSDLNIVAIAPKAKAKPIKKKKNNKYERRRQKAQRARNAEMSTTKSSSLSNSNDDIDFVESAPKKKEQTHKTKPVAGNNDKTKTDASQSPEVKDIKNDDDEKEQPSTVVSKEQISSKEQKKTNAKTGTADSGSKPKQPTSDLKNRGQSARTDASMDNAASSRETGDDTQPQSSSHRFVSTNNNDNKDDYDEEKEREHAQYMANFHARPMELDRRSGARVKSSSKKSKQSFHLFDDGDATTSNGWESLNLHARLLQTVTGQLKLSKPTTIQTRAIQTFFKQMKDNVLIQSETGSGKTLAYLLPILQLLGFDSSGNSNKQPRKKYGTRCIILCPTRELASQTLQVLERLCQLNFAGWLVPAGLLGGDSRNSEKSRLRKGVGIVVATPGRLLDHLNKTESLLLSLKGKVQWLVLDEADRLLDMGLGSQVKQIVQIIRANEASKSQSWWRSVLVSATVTPSVEALAKERMLCGDQKWIWVKGGGGAAEVTKNLGDGNSNETQNNAERSYAESTPRQLAQFHLTMTAKLRLSTLVAFLAQRVNSKQRTVVFFATCASVDYHYELLSAMTSIWANDGDDKDDDDKGIFGDKARIFKLHGSVAHDKRNLTLKRFDAAKKQSAILLTTDVAARGLNLPGVDWTVQYDPPCEISDYVHRVGRVARAGKAGHSVLFLLPSEKAYLDVLETKGVSNITAMSLAQVLNKAADLCPEWTSAGLKYGGTKEQTGRRNSRAGEYFSAELQRRLEDCVVQDDQEAKRLFKESKKRKRGESKFKEGKLMEMARAAFMSSLRAYPTKKEAAVRSIFSARALHLGHVARSFALKEPPKALVSKQKHTNAKNASLHEVEKPRSMDFSKLDANLVTHSFSDDEDDDATAVKRFPVKKGGKNKTSRALLLESAMKMQNNLMDAM